MKARLQFISHPQFNFSKLCLMAPCIIASMQHRALWTLCFKSTQQIDERTFEGEASWLVDPKNEGLVTGLKFKIISDPIKFAASHDDGILATGEILGND